MFGFEIDPLTAKGAVVVLVYLVFWVVLFVWCGWWQEVRRLREACRAMEQDLKARDEWDALMERERGERWWESEADKAWDERIDALRSQPGLAKSVTFFKTG